MLTARFGLRNLQVAEDLVQETLAGAMHYWALRGVPENPQAWLMTAARNKALNLLKHESRKARTLRRYPALDAESERCAPPPEATFVSEIEDSQLAMIFACCHPAIAPVDQVALVLSTLCGFGTREVARALLVGDEAAAKRLYRAKQAITLKGIALEVPGGEALKGRLESVCTCLYALFNEGYSSTESEELIRWELCAEAMRLCELLVARFPGRTELSALAALMHLHAARFETRVDGAGALVLLAEQDRSRWDAALLQRGLWHLTESAQGELLSAWHLEASIAAQHCLAPSLAETNWPQIRVFYERLLALKPHPIIRVNLAVVTSRIEGPEPAVTELEVLLRDPKLRRFAPLYATLGVLRAELGRSEDAREALRQAHALTRAPQERRFLEQRLAEL